MRKEIRQSLEESMRRITAMHKNITQSLEENMHKIKKDGIANIPPITKEEVFHSGVSGRPSYTDGPKVVIQINPILYKELESIIKEFHALEFDNPRGIKHQINRYCSEIIESHVAQKRSDRFWKEGRFPLGSKFHKGTVR